MTGLVLAIVGLIGLTATFLMPGDQNVAAFAFGLLIGAGAQIAWKELQ